MENFKSLSFSTFVRLLFQSTLILTCTRFSWVEGACDKYGDVIIGMDVTGGVTDIYNGDTKGNLNLVWQSSARRQGIPFVVNLINGLNETRFRTAVFPWVKKDRINEFKAFPLSTNLTKQEKVAAIQRLTKLTTDLTDSGIARQEFSGTPESAVEFFNDPALAPRSVARILVSVTCADYEPKAVTMTLLKDNHITSLGVGIDTYFPGGTNYQNLEKIAQGIKSHSYSHASYAKVIKDIEELPCDPNIELVSTGNGANSPIFKAAEPE